MKSWKIFKRIFRGTKTTKLLQKDQTDFERARNSCARIILMLYTYLWSWLCMATLVPLPRPRAQIKNNCHKNWLNRKNFSFSSAYISPRTTVFPPEMMSEARNEGRYSILMTCHSPDLGGAFNWSSCKGTDFLQPIKKTTQIWVVTRHQHGISAVVPQISFQGKLMVASQNGAVPSG